MVKKKEWKEKGNRTTSSKEVVAMEKQKRRIND